MGSAHDSCRNVCSESAYRQGSPLRHDTLEPAVGVRAPLRNRRTVHLNTEAAAPAGSRFTGAGGGKRSGVA
ncbi:hypothetical protein CYMTET_36737 [Cymbomonas tetramitiformis]|uniref:Uncharacterized protein n=1 Tax=Cymbomonas tetramitiformis TaxID=36881 RepID=A0AAE0CFD3_9CHLO|nr:hypothetical protein CYMTET_36737 [Cymbomonas tetramitiformis]